MENDNKKKITHLGRLDFSMVKNLTGDNPQSTNDVDDGLSSVEVPEAFKKLGDEIKSLDIDKVTEIKPPNINFDLKTLSLTLAQIKKLSNDDLQMLLSGEGYKGFIHNTTMQLISNEILSRQIKEASKPHWIEVLTFFLVFISTIATMVSLYYVILQK